MYFLIFSKLLKEQHVLLTSQNPWISAYGDGDGDGDGGDDGDDGSGDHNYADGVTCESADNCAWVYVPHCILEVEVL